jgi:hypothetical protein
MLVAYLAKVKLLDEDAGLVCEPAVLVVSTPFT